MIYEQVKGLENHHKFKISSHKIKRIVDVGEIRIHLSSKSISMAIFKSVNRLEELCSFELAEKSFRRLGIEYSVHCQSCADSRTHLVASALRLLWVARCSC